MKINRISCTPASMFAGVFLSMLSLFSASCAKKTPPAPAPVAVSKVDKYTVRGVVDELPDPSRPGATELQIHHENIPMFKDKNGKIIGMHSMIMGFPPGPGAVAPDLKKGDKIEIDFEVSWTGKDPFYFTAIRKLPSDVALDFSK